MVKSLFNECHISSHICMKQCTILSQPKLLSACSSNDLENISYVIYDNFKFCDIFNKTKIQKFHQINWYLSSKIFIFIWIMCNLMNSTPTKISFLLKIKFNFTPWHTADNKVFKIFQKKIGWEKPNNDNNNNKEKNIVSNDSNTARFDFQF